MTALPVGPLIEKTTQSVKAKTGTYDAISVLGFTVSQFVGGGYFSNLTPMVEAAAGLRLSSGLREGELDYLSTYNIRRQAFGGTTPHLIPVSTPGRSHVLPQDSSTTPEFACQRTDAVPQRRRS